MFRGVTAAVCASLLLVAWPASAGAAFPADGKRWRQVNELVGVTAAQLAAACPQDGASRCSSLAGGRNVDGWIWATQAQVIALMGHYEPSILSADPPSVSGPELLFQAMTFLEDMHPTFFFSGYPTTVGSVSGWTASGTVASAGYQHPLFSGSFGVSEAVDEPSAWRGAWLWRPASDDITPPVVRANVSGTLGSQGWYRSDVTVNWTVEDPDSPVSATSGCATATVTADTAGTTFTCTATSGGGTTTVSSTVMRDTVPPTIMCNTPAPTFEPNQVGGVSGFTGDALSGPPNAPFNLLANTNTAGSFFVNVSATDRAGNRATGQCPYKVVIPSTCNGLQATIIGTGLNNVINGTSGRDVIVALGGNDTVNGGGGDDVICAGEHQDTVNGGAGNDWIDGGGHNDDLNGGDGNDFLDGGLGSDSLRGDGGRDTCVSGEVRTSSCEA